MYYDRAIRPSCYGPNHFLTVSLNMQYDDGVLWCTCGQTCLPLRPEQISNAAAGMPENETFATGSRRDNPSGKPRYDLIPTGWLDSLAERLEYGAVRYGENNWKLGQPVPRLIASAMRHLIQFRDGDTSENHAGAVAWNVLCAQWTLAEIEAGRLPEALR